MQKEEQKSILQRLRVVNKYKHEPTSDDVYIGRGSIFGNPYSHIPSSDKNVIMCDTREESINAYRTYFQDIIDGCGCKNKRFKRQLREMIVKLKLGGEVNLVCYCKPKTCHGDIIKEYLLTQI